MVKWWCFREREERNTVQHKNKHFLKSVCSISSPLDNRAGDLPIQPPA